MEYVRLWTCGLQIYHKAKMLCSKLSLLRKMVASIMHNDMQLAHFKGIMSRVEYFLKIYNN
jgi:hypothetical protein